MNVVDILISIVVVTILVTIILAIVTYVAYKLRLSREPERQEDDPSALRYFTPYPPPGAEKAGGQAGTVETSGHEADASEARVGAGAGGGEGVTAESGESALDRLDREVADPEGHASST